MILKDKIGEEPTSYIVIAIAGVLGFIGFVRIHELPAEQIIPYWFRHYFLFAKPIHYISDEEYALQHQKKKIKSKKVKLSKAEKLEIKEMKKKKKQEKYKESESDFREESSCDKTLKNEKGKYSNEGKKVL